MVGQICARGRLQMFPSKAEKVYAGCTGSISPHPLPPVSRGDSFKPVIAIVSQELIELQQSYLSSGGNSAIAERLITMGMTARQVERVQARGTPIKAVTLSCPTAHAVAHVLEPGTRFELHACLFEHGPLTPVCEIAEVDARHIDPGARVIVTPKLQRAGSRPHGGYVVELRPSRHEAHLRQVIVALDEAMAGYPVETVVEVLISVPRMSGNLDCSGVVERTFAKPVKPVPVLPSRSTTRPVHVPRPGPSAEQADAAQRLRARSLQIEQPSSAPVSPASRSPERQVVVAADVPRLTLTEKLWAEAGLRTSIAILQSMPLVRVQGCVGRLAELGLQCRPLKDEPRCQILPIEPPAPHFIKVAVNADQYATLSQGQIRATLELAAGPVMFEGHAYGTHTDRWSKLKVFGLKLPNSISIAEGDTSTWVGLSTTEDTPDGLMVPTYSVKHIGAGQGRVLAHIGVGTLAVLEVRLGRSGGRLIEVADGIEEGTAVVSDLAGAADRLGCVTKGTRDRKKGKELLALLR